MISTIKKKKICSSYNSIKSWIQGGNAATPLGPSMHMLAASEAGILTLLMTNPIWVVKTR
jgi:solute carrier family 25 (mitochondrial folate transporter), member 32